VQLIPSGSSLTFIVRNGQQRASPATIASRRSRTVEPGANRSSARMPTRRDSSRAASPSAAISARRAENSVALSEHAIGWSVAWIPPRLWVAVPLRFRVNLGLSQEPDSHDADDVHNRPARAAFGTECVRDPLLRARRRLARAGARERAAPPRRRGGKRVERLQTAKQAGFTLQEARLLLQAARPATRCTSRCASSQRASCPKSRRSSPGPRACARGCWQPPAAHAKPSMRVRCSAMLRARGIRRRSGARSRFRCCAHSTRCSTR
jgi:hypothetical protein